MVAKQQRLPVSSVRSATGRSLWFCGLSGSGLLTNAREFVCGISNAAEKNVYDVNKWTLCDANERTSATLINDRTVTRTRQQDTL